MHRLGKLFVATALAVVPMACKDDVRKDADKAAERLQDQKEDLREESEELRDTVKENKEDDRDRLEGLRERAVVKANEKEQADNVKELADEAKDVTEQAAEVAEAKDDFQYRRQLRASQLRALHSVVASQPMLINTIASGVHLTDRANANLSEKMQIFQMRLDEAGNAIELLQQTHEDNFERKNDDVSKAMERLEDAREDTWEALNDGDRIQPS